MLIGDASYYRYSPRTKRFNRDADCDSNIPCCSLAKPGPWGVSVWSCRNGEPGADVIFGSKVLAEFGSEEAAMRAFSAPEEPVTRYFGS